MNLNKFTVCVCVCVCEYYERGIFVSDEKLQMRTGCHILIMIFMRCCTCPVLVKKGLIAEI